MKRYFQLTFVVLVVVLALILLAQPAGAASGWYGGLAGSW